MSEQQNYKEAMTLQHLLYLSCLTRKPFSGFLSRSDTNRALLPQKVVRNLKFQIKEVEGLYYLCRESKGTDQLRRY